MELLPIHISQNQNFYFDDEGILCHFSGRNIGEPHYRFRNNSKEYLEKYFSKEELENYVCSETIKIYSTGVLVECDSNCFDIEDEISGYNRDDDDVSFKPSEELEGFISRTSKQDKRRHYINKMFFNNNGEMIFSQRDYQKFATLIGDELVRLCDSTVKITDKGIEIKRSNIAKEFPDMTNTIGNYKESGKQIKVDNSCNVKEQEFLTYAELNQKYKQTQEAKNAYWKKRQEDQDWDERNEERLAKFGFNNVTLKTTQGKAVFTAYKKYKEAMEKAPF